MMLRNIFGLKGANRDSDNGFEIDEKGRKMMRIHSKDIIDFSMKF